MADFSSVSREKCRETKLPNGCELRGSHTVVLQSVINEIKQHGRSSMHKEVCGVLVGSLCWDNGPYLLIDGRIEGKHASHQSGSVTFTSETWDYIHEELAAKHHERIIVGWYHTHPGFGIFLSNMDAFTHENFFSFPWQPAYVFDPQAETDGFFFCVGGELMQEEVCVIADVEPSIKEPFMAGVASDKIVVEDVAKRRYVFLFIAAALAVCCLSAIAMLTITHIHATEDAAKVAELQAEKLRGALADKNSEIQRHQEEAKEWRVRKETYEKEIAGLRINMTTITAEWKNLEASNKEKQSEIDRMRSEREKLSKAVQERELQIDEKNQEVAQLKSSQASDREKIQKLEQRIRDLEVSTLPADKKCEMPQQDDAKPGNPNLQGITTKQEKAWYSWLLFWRQ